MPGNSPIRRVGLALGLFALTCFARGSMAQATAEAPHWEVGARTVGGILDLLERR